MGKHEYYMCKKCKGHNICECESKSIVNCLSFVRFDSQFIWKNPTIDHFDKYQELLKKGKITL